ncbi:hypothetical protein DPN68_13030, partial [Flavobacterium tibetense]
PAQQASTFNLYLFLSPFYPPFFLFLWGGLATTLGVYGGFPLLRCWLPSPFVLRSPCGRPGWAPLALSLVP